MVGLNQDHNLRSKNVYIFPYGKVARCCFYMGHIMVTLYSFWYAEHTSYPIILHLNEGLRIEGGLDTKPLTRVHFSFLYLNPWLMILLPYNHQVVEVKPLRGH